MASLETAKYNAQGDIRPSRFVKQTGDFQVQEADAGDPIVGISQDGARAAPIPENTTLLAAQLGDDLIVFGPGQIVLLEIGAAVSQGDFLKSDADGRGITGAANLDNVGAFAIQDGAGAGEIIQVRVDINERSVA